MDLAEQMTLLDAQLFLRLDSAELILWVQVSLCIFKIDYHLQYISQRAKMANLIQKLFMGLQCSDMAFLHTTGLLKCQRFQKNYKRQTKVRKAISKARDKGSQIMTIFSCHCDHLVLIMHRFHYFLVSRSLSSKRPH